MVPRGASSSFDTFPEETNADCELDRFGGSWPRSPPSRRSDSQGTLRRWQAPRQYRNQLGALRQGALRLAWACPALRNHGSFDRDAVNPSAILSVLA